MSSVSAKVDLSPLKVDTAELLARLTSGRAGNLDRLDTTVSSRGTAAALATVDAVVDVLAGRITAGRASNLDNLNASVSSRASQTSVNALPVTPIKSIQRGAAENVNDVGGSGNKYYFDVTITAVTQAKTEVRGWGSGTNTNAGALPYSWLSGTAIRFYAPDAQLARFAWEVVEYE